MRNTNPNNHDYRIVGQGKQLKSKQQPLAVRFPPNVLTYLRSREDTQDFIRAAVLEKIEREGLLPLLMDFSLADKNSMQKSSDDI